VEGAVLKGVVFCCPYDDLPCERYSDDLGCGVCEHDYLDVKGVRRFDVCSRFVLNDKGKVVEVYFDV
jgi:hypothetical protein